MATFGEVKIGGVFHLGDEFKEVADKYGFPIGPWVKVSWDKYRLAWGQIVCTAPTLDMKVDADADEEDARIAEVCVIIQDALKARKLENWSIKIVGELEVQVTKHLLAGREMAEDQLLALESQVGNWLDHLRPKRANRTAIRKAAENAVTCFDSIISEIDNLERAK
jgi:hypothetical protein